MQMRKQIKRLYRRALSFTRHNWRYRWRFSPLPVYWSRFSRDCDLCERSWVERWPNGWSAYRAYCNALDYAEGPEHFHAITRREYESEQGKAYTRDRAAEMMNY